MKRWIYVLIPLGFVLIVATMVLIGRPTGGPVAPEPQQIETEPLATGEAPDTNLGDVVDPDTDSAGVPSPSGPEYGDNETILEEVQD
ncbi:hypothetical protein [Marivita sp. XM-24bin2]|jgi:hypothetical protein|uniref:hypothetical protein n=1 Tax=unclassified Marivita TaxID=2632480 RepID=UPI000D7B643B|nr:hypothetical protein [Marivita sp. XM-24bin2]MCR9108459.1 hypothetical protein [Paracoccaceae bacterium]PWL34406.1 MAG: hypothetical protein DCO97_14700 [Marivita sp. XM-24bin2]